MGQSKLILLAITLLVAAFSAKGAQVVVPNPGLNWEGNSHDFFPFMIKAVGLTSARYQQVYGASQFSAISSNGALITQIFFRLDCVRKFGVARATNVQINLSTTLKAPDNLSPVFAENIGADDTVVSGPGEVPLPGPFEFGCPIPFDNGIVLSTPFFYSPSRGNLLLDVRNFSAGSYFPPPEDPPLKMDAANIPGDSVSRVYAESVTATNATRVDTTGLVTRFEFQPIPQLTIDPNANSAVITWPAEPSVFVLQSSESLAPAAWQTMTNGIGGDTMIRSFTVSQASSGPNQFFRLVWESGPPNP